MAVVGTTTYERLYHAFGSGAFTRQQLLDLAELIDFATAFNGVEVIPGGNSQGTATAVSGGNVIITTAAPGSGIRIEGGATVFNRAPVDILAWPMAGNEFESQGVNQPVEIASNGRVQFVQEADTPTQWRVG